MFFRRRKPRLPNKASVSRFQVGDVYEILHPDEQGSKKNPLEPSLSRVMVVSSTAMLVDFDSNFRGFSAKTSVGFVFIDPNEPEDDFTTYFAPEDTFVSLQIKKTGSLVAKSPVFVSTKALSSSGFTKEWDRLNPFQHQVAVHLRFQDQHRKGDFSIGMTGEIAYVSTLQNGKPVAFVLISMPTVEGGEVKEGMFFDLRDLMPVAERGHT